MHLIAKAIMISRAEFHCNDLYDCTKYSRLHESYFLAHIVVAVVWCHPVTSRVAVSSSQRPSSAISAFGSTRSCPCVNMSRMLLRHVFSTRAVYAPFVDNSATTRRFCATDLGPCAVAPRLLQCRPHQPPGGDNGTTAEFCTQRRDSCSTYNHATM